ncbi:type III polyketide synthase [Allosphingosinicella sp.]|uniref:type III polyketide synthase n=1 Tax=Allosphingosinicella sp. TaxID=2823234 RepID=UPI002F24E8FA
MDEDGRSYINAIGTAVPGHDVHRAFIDWAQGRIEGERERALFRRMAERSGIEHRWSVLPPAEGGGSPVEPGGFYGGDAPPTSRRMQIYSEEAPGLALEAIAALRGQVPVEGVTHLVVASCTGFTAPGIDQIVAEALGIPEAERTLVGFMGCYAAVSALRVAHHIVRSEPGARVLAVTVELSSLHLQDATDVEPLLAMLQFSDGAAAALVSSDPVGFAIGHNFALSLAGTSSLITWTIGDTGFAMQLSGEVPARIGAALQEEEVRARMLGDWRLDEVDAWAVHAGGRSILDSVEKALALDPAMLAASRDVLARFGNMSSSTLMFVLAEILRRPEQKRGIALAFGPGLAAEGFHFERRR